MSSPDGSHHEIHHSGPRAKGRWECHYYAASGEKKPDFDVIDPNTPITPTAGNRVALVCVDEAGNEVYKRFFVYDPANPWGPLEAAGRAADEARRLLPLDPPRVGLSPPASTAQLVGIPTWFWIDDPWSPLSASASLGGVTSTVVATPGSLIFSLDDGTSFSCEGPGTAYDPSRDPSEEQSTCTHTFERRGTFAVTATVTYTTHWTANTGEGGDLDDVTRTTTVPITVEEAQALIH